MSCAEEKEVLPWHIEVVGAGYVRCNGIYEWVDSFWDGHETVELMHDGWYEKLGDKDVFLVLHPLHGPRLSSQSPMIHVACPRALDLSVVDRLEIYRSSDGSLCGPWKVAPHDRLPEGCTPAPEVQCLCTKVITCQASEPDTDDCVLITCTSLSGTEIASIPVPKLESIHFLWKMVAKTLRIPYGMVQLLDIDCDPLGSKLDEEVSILVAKNCSSFDGKEGVDPHSDGRSNKTS